MHSDEDLDAAFAAGVIDDVTLVRLRTFLAERAGMLAGDEERFRLVTGFNDIFVSIAIVLLLVALAWIGASITPHSPVVAGAAVAAAAWPLAELFTARRRMALPSILLLVAFVGGIFAAVIGAGHSVAGLPWELMSRSANSLLVAIAASVAAAAAWAHWRRFHVPITVAAGTAALVALGLSLLLAAAPDLASHLLPLTFVAGLGVFALAMRWDISDPARTTRRADVAFWLHLLAAPMIVHPVFALLGVLHGAIETDGAVSVIALYVALGVVALAIDRRALMVSALAYVLYALSTLFRQFGALSLATALTALVLGSALLLLSAYWGPARAAIVRLLPERWRERLPATALSPRSA